MWSLGCVVYLLSAQRVPFLKSLDVRRFCTGALSFPEKPLYVRMSEIGIEFIKRLLMPQPAQRACAENGREDPWILNIPPIDRIGPKPTASGGMLGVESGGIAVVPRPIPHSDSSQSYKVAKPLLNRGADLSAASSSRWTLLNLASHKDYVKIVKLLLN